LSATRRKFPEGDIDLTPVRPESDADSAEILPAESQTTAFMVVHDPPKSAGMNSEVALEPPTRLPSRDIQVAQEYGCLKSINPSRSAARAAVHRNASHFERVEIPSPTTVDPSSEIASALLSKFQPAPTGVSDFVPDFRLQIKAVSVAVPCGLSAFVQNPTTVEPSPDIASASACLNPGRGKITCIPALSWTAHWPPYTVTSWRLPSRESALTDSQPRRSVTGRGGLEPACPTTHRTRETGNMTPHCKSTVTELHYSPFFVGFGFNVFT